MTDDVPEIWAAAMIRRGFVDRRWTDAEVPSIRALASAAGLSHETVRRMINGKGTADQDSIIAVADALGPPVTVVTVSEWVGQARQLRKPYEAPSEAHLLNEDERKAIDSIIRLLAAGKKGVNDGARHLRAARPRSPHQKPTRPPNT